VFLAYQNHVIQAWQANAKTSFADLTRNVTIKLEAENRVRASACGPIKSRKVVYTRH
jgi:hypothetical protein